MIGLYNNDIKNILFYNGVGHSFENISDFNQIVTPQMFAVRAAAIDFFACHNALIWGQIDNQLRATYSLRGAFFDYPPLVPNKCFAHIYSPGAAGC
jgi:hypothetical protein